MAKILIADTLKVDSAIGECQIQLCVGDITTLPKEDEVDVLVISAFPDDYVPTPPSLIGQLLLQLNVDIRQLAKDKEEDLRSLYSCWWSKPLPDHLSFSKILCFEGGFKCGKKSPQVVGDIFRCLVPALGNTEAKVMMPLLASGAQKFSKKLMLEQLVKAAIHWMEAGLPLRCLKIVLLQSDPSNTGLILLFKSMKNSYRKGTMEKQREHSNEYDIYLSYCEEDKKHTDHIIECLKKNKSNVRIFSTMQELDMEESWQEQLYDTITSCKRVVALISSSYLKSTTCIEQYNIALCHSRKLHHSVLIPLYLSDVVYMPTYMGITQYIDCRVNDKEKIAAACVTVTDRLTPLQPLQPLQLLPEQKVVERFSTREGNYDVFLSYSHFNEDVAERIMKELRIYQPDVNIFIDTAELKAGGAWQQALYEAIDRSHLMIALISNHYLRSKVCVEELSLAIALQRRGTSKVWPIVIESLEQNLEWLNFLSPVECFDETLEKQNSSISSVCKNIVRDIRENAEPTDLTNYQGVSKIRQMAPLTTVLEDARVLIQNEDQFTSTIRNGLMLLQESEQDGVPSATKPSPKIPNHVDIYVISSAEDAKYCQLFCEILISHNQSLIIKKSLEESNSACLNYLENARLVIPLLSSSFMKSTELVHELNIAWCRQRYAPDICFLAVTLNYLPDKPTYVNLLPCFFDCTDKLWKEPPSKVKEHSSSYKLNLIRSNKAPPEILHCFANSIELLLGWLTANDCPVFGLHDKFTNYIHLATCVQHFKNNSLIYKEKSADEQIRSQVNKDEASSIAIGTE